MAMRATSPLDDCGLDIAALWRGGRISSEGADQLSDQARTIALLTCHLLILRQNDDGGFVPSP